MQYWSENALPTWVIGNLLDKSKLSGGVIGAELHAVISVIRVRVPVQLLIDRALNTPFVWPAGNMNVALVISIYIHILNTHIPTYTYAYLRIPYSNN